MPQLVLSPDHTAQATGSRALHLVDPKVRKFGFVPDIDRLLAGDLILYSSGKAVDAISIAQTRAGFSSDDARWTHAAVYLDDAYLVEAVTAGVSQRSIYAVPKGLIRFRRIKGLSEVERYRIALRALSRLGKPYSVGGVTRLGMNMLGGLWNRSADADLKGLVICSQVYHDSVVEITRSYLQHCPVASPVTPAHLSSSASFEDIDVPWLRLL